MADGEIKTDFTLNLRGTIETARIPEFVAQLGGLITDLSIEVNFDQRTVETESMPPTAARENLIDHADNWRKFFGATADLDSFTLTLDNLGLLYSWVDDHAEILKQRFSRDRAVFSRAGHEFLAAIKNHLALLEEEEVVKIQRHEDEKLKRVIVKKPRRFFEIAGGSNRSLMGPRLAAAVLAIADVQKEEAEPQH